jgi:mono/diheme cytochrome c family protein
MMQPFLALGTVFFGVVFTHSRLPAEEPSPVDRGRTALLERPFNSLVWSAFAYQNAWKQWNGGAPDKPQDYSEAFRDRYGLHPSPYPNNDYPMGIRPVRGLLGSGLTTDCMLCHGGSILGKSYIGLPNSTLDMQALYEELATADGRSPKTPFTFTNVRGTTEAGAMAVYLYGFREPDLKIRSSYQNLGVRADLCEDPPAWWLLKKKKSMYHTGSGDARSVRSLMQFMLSPLNSATSIKNEEATFRDIQAYLLSLEPPKYPFPVDSVLAEKGKAIFTNTCTKCHGTYGDNWTYPNKIVPIDTIDTDRTRLEGLPEQAGLFYNTSWFAHERAGWFADEFRARGTTGYQAPPLDGIWATAPYFHNGSVPTVYHVLNSKARPKIYTRSFRTDETAYDLVKLGWKIQELKKPADPSRPAIERRKIYDTTQPGRGNGGHPFGDSLTEEERLAVIEYLKTL